MNINEDLKNLILDRYSSIREFSIVADMPYSTLDSIFKRGINNASISNIIKICNVLGISADALASGSIAKKSSLPDIRTDIHTIAAHHNGEDWTEEELEEIEKFKEFVKSKRNNPK